jgi:agmatinase
MSELVFGDIPGRYAFYEHSQVVILPVPYEHSTTYLKGTAQGPRAILNASHEIELFDEYLKQETFHVGIHTLPFIQIDSHSEAFVNQLDAEVDIHLGNDKIVAVLGGEHTITLGSLKATKKHFPRIGVLQIDAHADLRDSYQDDPYSHACVMKRVLEHAPVYQIGIRSLSREEYALIENEEVRTLFSHEISPETLEPFLAGLPEDIYLTIDMDAFDPAVVPGVGNPDPGGLDWGTVNQILEAVSARCRIRGVDIVELRPLVGEARSEITAARLLYRVVGYIARDQLLL